MTPAELRQSTRRPRVDVATHIFEVGQTVRIKSGFGMVASKTVETYRVTATLPPRDNSPQYRIRSDEERHDRMATQESLELVGADPVGDDAELMAKTFGGGTAADARASEDAALEAGDPRS